MTLRITTVALLGLMTLAACGREGTPETETTGTVQAPSETSTASATTTGSTGGTVSNMTTEDKKFVARSGAGGLAGMQMANLALEKATNAGVKAFAGRMVTDHSKTNEELSQFATTKGLALPTELDRAHQAGVDHLSSLSGAEFERAYMQHVMDDHRAAVADFERASTGAADADLKAWAERTLPALREHLRLAQETAEKLK